MCLPVSHQLKFNTSAKRNQSSNQASKAIKENDKACMWKHTLLTGNFYFSNIITAIVQGQPDIRREETFSGFMLTGTAKENILIDRRGDSLSQNGLIFAFGGLEVKR